MKTCKQPVYVSAIAILLLLTNLSCSSPDRQDPPMKTKDRATVVVKTIEEANTGISKQDRETKYCKMACSKFVFYRGTNQLFWKDFAGDNRLKDFGNAKTKIWLSGDMHAENFGAYDNNRGEIVYSLDDFDDGIIADYQYDVWRMAASLALVGRQNGLSAEEQNNGIDAFSESYLDTMASYRGNDRELETYFTKDNTYGKLDDFLEGVEASESRQKMLKKWTELDPNQRRFNLSKVKLGKPTASERQDIENAIADYQKTLTKKFKYDKNYFRVKDIAQRLLAGTGSLGIPRYYLLIEGETSSQDDDRILDIKFQSSPTAYDYLSQQEREKYDKNFNNEGQRHALAYRALTKHTDNHLGWMKLGDGYYSVRERSPFKETFDITELTKEKRFVKLAEQWGQVLATAHARADKDFDAALVPYSIDKQVDELTDGRHKEFRQLVREVALTYADQVEKDYGYFLEKLKPNSCSSGTCD
ncbi:hypothetical protein LYNGBM3L_63840 [Moorena producens 3L]|uniref:DUF2252 domain-containing protein n=3 Tax=Coleofasciculaceae TaxID=1892251 RepID=F4Y0V9_9CYAN|nr:hypothetical protein LYNGBM3L_63840 [Moorena producens 3L]OLT67937.1 hypothetical protein BI334_25515 [Moorena producens 3L]